MTPEAKGEAQAWETMMGELASLKRQHRREGRGPLDAVQVELDLLIDYCQGHLRRLRSR